MKICLAKILMSLLSQHHWRYYLVMKASIASHRRLIVAVAVSLAVHALLVLAYRNAGLATPPPATPLTIAVTIAPPPSPPEPSEPPAARVERTAPAQPIAAAPRPARRAPPREVIAVPEPSSEQPDPFAVQQPDSPAPVPAPVPNAAPTFDMDAARRIARENAHLRAPAKEGTALAQFPEPPLQTESKLSRAIGAAKRGNCKDGLPGGLLAPIYLLMEKKDSGCKW